MYDFDTSEPLKDMLVENGNMEISKEFYMTKNQSLKWSTKVGSSITFTSPAQLQYVFHEPYFASIGIFQRDKPTSENGRSFKLECLSSSNTVLFAFDMNLHKDGWNILGSKMDVNGKIIIAKVRLIQTTGINGDVYLDNAMLYVVSTTGSDGWCYNNRNYKTYISNCEPK